MKKIFQDLFKPGKASINIDDFKKTITKEIDHIPKSNDIIIKPKELDREVYLNVTFIFLTTLSLGYLPKRNNRKARKPSTYIQHKHP